MDATVFIIAAVIIMGGAIGVVLSRNPVHAALFLVGTLFGVAVLFVLQDATFLAAVQVIVYAGAIVILFLFVIMLLGVDRAEDLGVEPIAGQRPLTALIGASMIGLLLTVLLVAVDGPTGKSAATAPLDDVGGNTRRLGEVLFTDYVFAVELTALLLTVAVGGAVVLSRRVTGPLQPIPGPDPTFEQKGDASEEDGPTEEEAAQ